MEGWRDTRREYHATGSTHARWCLSRANTPELGIAENMVETITL